MSSVHSSAVKPVEDLPSPQLQQRSREKRLIPSSSEVQLSSVRGIICVLDDPNLGVISLNDHNVQACLCKYCSCGQHKCPGAPFHNPYPKSMYASQYQHAFVPGSLAKQLQPPRPLPAKNYNKMDLLTIYEQDYRPFRVEGEEQVGTASGRGSQGGESTDFKGAEVVGRGGIEGKLSGYRSTQSGLSAAGAGSIVGLRGSQSNRPQYRARSPKVAPFPKFSGVSSYHIEFPSFGSSSPYYLKRMYDGVPTREMPFEAKSIYTDTFRPAGPKDPFASKVAKMGKQDNIGGFNSNVKMFTKTSSGSAFQPIAREFLGVRFPRKYERELTADLAFATTEYKDRYVEQPPLMTNPHAIRRELDAQTKA